MNNWIMLHLWWTCRWREIERSGGMRPQPVGLAVEEWWMSSRCLSSMVARNAGQTEMMRSTESWTPMLARSSAQTPCKRDFFWPRRGQEKHASIFRVVPDVIGDRQTNHAIEGKEPLCVFSRALRATLLDLTASDFCMMLIGEPVSESKKPQSQLEYQCQGMGEERGVLVKHLMQWWLVYASHLWSPI